MPLRCIEGLDTRPTTDRIKETLFNMLQPEIPGCRFLDLFGGSGAIGIEALSRGADFAAFAENNRKAYDCISDNLVFTKLDDRARVFFMDALGALRVLEGEEPFDIIFLDPPYAYDAMAVLGMAAGLVERGVAAPDAIVVYEHSLAGNDAAALAAAELGFELASRKKYGDTTVDVLRAGERAAFDND